MPSLVISQLVIALRQLHRASTCAVSSRREFYRNAFSIVVFFIFYFVAHLYSNAAEPNICISLLILPAGQWGQSGQFHFLSHQEIKI